MTTIAALPTQPSTRAATVAGWFGLSLSPINQRPPVTRPITLPAAGQIVLICGPSGSGKSTLLRHYRRRLGKSRWIDLNGVCLADKPVIELFANWPLEEALHLLSRFGLAEAHIYLRHPRHLSTGQRWRLRVAVGLYQALHVGGDGLVCLACDEFAAVLDRVTAAIVCHCLRRQIGYWPRLCAIVASAQDDLLQPLRPDISLRCGFDW